MSNDQDNQGQSTGGHTETAYRLLLQEMLLQLGHLTRVVEQLSATLQNRPEVLPCTSCSKASGKELLDHLEGRHEGPYENKLHDGPDLGAIAAQRDGPEHSDGHRQLNPGSIPALPADLYMVNENGHRQVVTAEKAQQIRQEWSGHFLLDLPRQSLLIRTGKTVKRVQLGSGHLHWGVQKFFIVGMSQPGVGFGYAQFSKVCPGGSGIGDVTVLTRYAYEARRAIRDSGKRGRYIRKMRVELSESPTRWGYVFDDQYRYLVIAKNSPANYGRAAKSTAESRVDPESGQ